MRGVRWKLVLKQWWKAMVMKRVSSGNSKDCGKGFQVVKIGSDECCLSSEGDEMDELNRSGGNDESRKERREGETG